MTADSTLLDPEVEALLREVAADPHSSLLRVHRADAVPTLYETRPAAGPATPGLTAAERELLRAHRLEVAGLLRELCLVRLMEGTISQYFINRFTTPGAMRVTRRPLALLRDSSLIAAHGVDDRSADAARTLLHLAVTRFELEDPSVSELAAAAHRLQPCHETRVLTGQDLAIRHSPRAALLLLRSVIESNPGTTVGVSTWSAIGLAHLRLRNHHLAHSAYIHSSALDPSRPGTWMDRFALAVQVGDLNDAIIVSNHLDNLLGQNEPVVAWYIDSRMRRRQMGEWGPTATAVHFTKSTRERLGLAARRLCDVFA